MNQVCKRWAEQIPAYIMEHGTEAQGREWSDLPDFVWVARFPAAAVTAAVFYSTCSHSPSWPRASRWGSINQSSVLERGGQVETLCCLCPFYCHCSRFAHYTASCSVISHFHSPRNWGRTVCVCVPVSLPHSFLSSSFLPPPLLPVFMGEWWANGLSLNWVEHLSDFSSFLDSHPGNSKMHSKIWITS